MPASLTRILLICLLICSLFIQGKSQTDLSTTGKEQLYQTIRLQDSLLFVAFNNRDINRMKQFFTADLEVFQDNVGVRNYTETINAFGELFQKDYVLTRRLVPGTLEVYPVKGFGAIETGSHEFCHVENGKEECAVFKFAHVWQKTDAGWQIKRLITYDHR